MVMDSIKGNFDMGDHMAFVNELIGRTENGVLVIADAGPFFHSIRKINLLSMSYRCHPNLI
jgi:hypothetical protein